MASDGAPTTRKERSSTNATTEVGPQLDDTSTMAALVGGVLKGGGFISDASLDSGHGQRDQILVWFPARPKLAAANFFFYFLFFFLSLVAAHDSWLWCWVLVVF